MTNLKALAGTPIAWPLRAWLVVEVFFGVAASLSIGLSPEKSATNFAWPIQPTVMAAVLGAFYMTTAPLFVLPLLAKRWEMLRVMILPTVLFTTVQLIVTFLHWEKFLFGTTPFNVWFASYVLPPPIFLAVYWWQERQAKAHPVAAQNPLAAGLRKVLLPLGALFLLVAIPVFLFPQLLIPHFAWKLSPLTTRSLCGWLVLVGSMLLSLWRENSRGRSVLAAPMLILVLPMLLLQMGRFSGQVSWSNPALLAGLAMFAAVFGCGLVLAKGNWREALS